VNQLLVVAIWCGALDDGHCLPSPDGKWVVFSATDVDLEANTKTSHLWIVPANGGESITGSM
jgi:hypothetical protein